MKKVISYSLFSSVRGSPDRYVRGALRAAEINARIFPGWEMHVYLSNDLASHTDDLESLGVCVHLRQRSSNLSGLYWRYEPICNLTDATIIFRDCDCRPSNRERRLVDLWLASAKTFHFIRDVPRHRQAIMGGLWGVRNPPEWLREIFSKRIEDRCRVEVPYGDDEDWLEMKIYPRARADAVDHDSQRDPSPFVDEPDGYLVGQSEDA